MSFLFKSNLLFTQAKLKKKNLSAEALLLPALVLHHWFSLISEMQEFIIAFPIVTKTP